MVKRCKNPARLGEVRRWGNQGNFTGFQRGVNRLVRQVQQDLALFEGEFARLGAATEVGVFRLRGHRVSSAGRGRRRGGGASLRGGQFLTRTPRSNLRPITET